MPRSADTAPAIHAATSAGGPGACADMATGGWAEALEQIAVGGGIDRRGRW